MKLLMMQMEFSQSLAALLVQIPKMGYDGVTMGDVLRSEAECKADAAAGTGIINSLHGIKLAVDLNFFKKGLCVDDGTQLVDVGEWWKARISPIPGAVYKWGGDITSRRDGNHFSLSPDNRI